MSRAETRPEVQKPKKRHPFDEWESAHATASAGTMDWNSAPMMAGTATNTNYVLAHAVPGAVSYTANTLT